MRKKISLPLAAVAVVAFALPASADAHAVTSKAGTLAPKGTLITATGIDPTWNSAILGPITCKSLTLTTEITENNGTNVTASGPNANPPTQDCTNGTHLIVTTKFDITRFAAEGTETNMSFVATVDFETLPPIECTFTGTKLPFTYTAGGNSIVFTKAGPITSTGGCGTATLNATFAIEIGSTPVILD
jgi:hypothetical protein